MDTLELDNELNNEGIHPSLYAIGKIIDNRHIILADGGIWKVFFEEKGMRTFEKEFKTEDKACRYFLKVVLDSWKSIKKPKIIF